MKKVNLAKVIILGIILQNVYWGGTAASVHAEEFGFKEELKDDNRLIDDSEVFKYRFDSLQERFECEEDTTLYNTFFYCDKFFAGDDIEKININIADDAFLKLKGNKDDYNLGISMLTALSGPTMNISGGTLILDTDTANVIDNINPATESSYLIVSYMKQGIVMDGTDLYIHGLNGIRADGDKLFQQQEQINLKNGDIINIDLDNGSAAHHAVTAYNGGNIKLQANKAVNLKLSGENSRGGDTSALQVSFGGTIDVTAPDIFIEVNTKNEAAGSNYGIYNYSWYGDGIVNLNGSNSTGKCNIIVTNNDDKDSYGILSMTGKGTGDSITNLNNFAEVNIKGKYALFAYDTAENSSQINFENNKEVNIITDSQGIRAENKLNKDKTAVKITGNRLNIVSENEENGIFAIYSDKGKVDINVADNLYINSGKDGYAAYVVNGGIINLNYNDNGGSATIYGNLFCKDEGTVNVGLTENSLLHGSVSITNDEAGKDGTANLRMDNGSKWEMTDDSIVTNLEVSGDSIVDIAYIRNGEGDFNKLKVIDKFAGNEGIVNMNIDASTNVENSDRLYIDGTHEGTHYITLNNIGSSIDGAVGTVLVSVNDEQGNFLANDSEGTLFWNTYELAKKTENVTEGYNTDWILAKAEIIPNKPTTGVDTILSVNSLNYHTWRTENDKLLQRMGELRHNGEEVKGAWVRVKGSKIGREGKFGFENKYTAYELGYDEITKRTEEKTRYQGAAISYTDGSSSYSRGSGDNSSKSISFYNTEIGSKGHYLDLVFKINNMDNDFTVYDTNSKKITGDFNNTGVALSAEYGRKNALKNGWYIEPQAQFTLGYLGGDNYITSNGIEVNQSGIKSAVGRIGFNIGKEIGSKGIVYAKANLLHEFGGGYDVTMTDSTGRVKVSDSFNDTWFEYGIGAAFASGENSHVYFDVERSAGSDFTKNWQWNIGARWNF